MEYDTKRWWWRRQTDKPSNQMCFWPRALLKGPKRSFVVVLLILVWNQVQKRFLGTKNVHKIKKYSWEQNFFLWTKNVLWNKKCSREQQSAKRNKKCSWEQSVMWIFDMLSEVSHFWSFLLLLLVAILVTLAVLVVLIAMGVMEVLGDLVLW